MTFYQDTLSLLISTFPGNNELAVVPDIFELPRKRERTWDDNFLDVHNLYEQGVSLTGVKVAKRHCPSKDLSQSDSRVGELDISIPQAPLERNSMQKDKTFSVTSYVNIPPSDSAKVDQEKAQLAITEEPEQFYRARYDSEGVRAPLKGINENYPTVQITGRNNKRAVVTVKLVHEDGSPHTCCSLDSSEDRKKALTKKVTPINNVMKAEFEDLRIRREKKKEGRKSGVSIDKNSTRDGKHDKVAYLLFSANIETDCGTVKCSVISSPISLTAAPEPAELDWLEPGRGHFGGKEVVVIKGSKMTSPKVLFQVRGVNGELIGLPGTVDKEKSHQNVLLVRTPIVNHLSYGLNHQCIQAKVVVITGRNQMLSNALDFEFIPNDICRECMQEAPLKSQNFKSAVCQSSSTIGVSVAPCSPLPSSSPIMQQSPDPVFSPELMQSGIARGHSPGPVFSPDFVQSEVAISPQNSQFHLDMLPMTSVQSIAASPTLPAVSREATTESAISVSCDNFQDYNAIPQPVMNSKERDILEIVEHLLSPAGPTCTSESNGLPQYTAPSCVSDSDSSVLYSTPSCNTTPSAGTRLPDTVKDIEETLVALQTEGKLSHSSFLFFMRECRHYNIELMRAFNVARGDPLAFLQELASIEAKSFQSTQL